MEAFDRHWRGVHKPARIAIRGVRIDSGDLGEHAAGGARAFDFGDDFHPVGRTQRVQRVDRAFAGGRGRLDLGETVERAPCGGILRGFGH